MKKPPNPERYTPIGRMWFNFNYIDRHFDQLTATECWPWTGARHRQGYGMCGGVETLASGDHRRFMTVVHRPIMMRHLARELGTTEFVIKTCGDAACCNPAHYMLGDHTKKVAVMKSFGRVNRLGRTKRAGIEYAQNRAYKYTPEEIAWMRDADTRLIAERYGVERSDAGQRRWYVRRHFKWLPWPNDPRRKGTDNE